MFLLELYDIINIRKIKKGVSWLGKKKEVSIIDRADSTCVVYSGFGCIYQRLPCGCSTVQYSLV